MGGVLFLFKRNIVVIKKYVVLYQSHRGVRSREAESPLIFLLP